MRMPRPIPLELLPSTARVRVPDGLGCFPAAAVIANVRFERAGTASCDAHRSADGGCGVVYIDAVNSAGAFEVPAGSRIEVDGLSMGVRRVERHDGPGGRVHHWKLEVV